MPWCKRGGIWIARVVPKINVNEKCFLYFLYHPGLILLRHARNLSLAVDI